MQCIQANRKEIILNIVQISKLTYNSTNNILGYLIIYFLGGVNVFDDIPHTQQMTIQVKTRI